MREARDWRTGRTSLPDRCARVVKEAQQHVDHRRDSRWGPRPQRPRSRSHCATAAGPASSPAMADEVAVWDGAAAEWVTNAGDGCRADVLAAEGPDGPALRFDFALVGHGAWAIVRRDFAIDMPAHYVVVLRVRGTGAVHELQVKLVGEGGANVWWWRRPDFSAGDQAMRVVLRKATLDFAWGPASGGDP